jgi:hypothetical protein
LRDGDPPPEPPKPLFELIYRVPNLDDSVRAAVTQAAADDRGAIAVYELVGRHVCVVHEEHATVCLDALRDKRPERLEPLRRNVREPKAEEHDVVASVWLPAEYVSS